MAYINVEKWEPEQVAEWVKGIDDFMIPYIHSFLNDRVSGRKLLMFSASSLEELKITRIGHQEIILEAIDVLRKFNYELENETLQTLAMRLGCKAKSLYRELCRIQSTEQPRSTGEKVPTSTIASVKDIVVAIKEMVVWLDKYPFETQEYWIELRCRLLSLGMELAATAQRDGFAEHPVETIRERCKQITEMCDEVVQDSTDPLVIQPAALEVTTIKKKPDTELDSPLLAGINTSKHIQGFLKGYPSQLKGIVLNSTYTGGHVISHLKFQSPAHACAKLESGFELVQVNYRTVLGWQQKKVAEVMAEHPGEVTLTVKRPPQHSQKFGQGYYKAIRLPSRKYTPWGEGTSLLTIPIISANRLHSPQHLSLPRPLHPVMLPPKIITPSPDRDEDAPEVLDRASDELSDDDDDDAFLPVGVSNPNPSPASMRLDFGKPRSAVQRRATVTGVSPTSSRPPINLEKLWKELRLKKQESATEEGRASTEKSSQTQQFFNLLKEVESSKKVSEEKPKLDKTQSLPVESFYEPIDTSNIPPKIEEEGQPRRPLHRAKAQEEWDKSNIPEEQSNKELEKAEKEANKVILRKEQQPKKEQVVQNGEAVSRRVSVQDLGGGDWAGWLYRRQEEKNFLRDYRWLKQWCVLKGHTLYGYRTRQDRRAQILIQLPGFRVSPATEVKSKKHVFKVFSAGTGFFFACESSVMLSHWLNKLGLAAINFRPTSPPAPPMPQQNSKNGYYSETDSEPEDSVQKGNIHRTHTMPDRKKSGDTQSHRTASERRSNFASRKPENLKVTIPDNSSQERKPTPPPRYTGNEKKPTPPPRNKKPEYPTSTSSFRHSPSRSIEGTAPPRTSSPRDRRVEYTSSYRRSAARSVEGVSGLTPPTMRNRKSDAYAFRHSCSRSMEGGMTPPMQRANLRRSPSRSQEEKIDMRRSPSGGGLRRRLSSRSEKRSSSESSSDKRLSSDRLHRTRSHDDKRRSDSELNRSMHHSSKSLSSSGSSLTTASRRNSIDSGSSSNRYGSQPIRQASRPESASPEKSKSQEHLRQQSRGFSSITLQSIKRQTSEPRLEGTPEQIWINSLRSDYKPVPRKIELRSTRVTKPEPTPATEQQQASSSPIKGKNATKLKSTALYQPVARCRATGQMRYAFEMNLDQSGGNRDGSLRTEGNIEKEESPGKEEHYKDGSVGKEGPYKEGSLTKESPSIKHDESRVSSRSSPPESTSHKIRHFLSPKLGRKASLIKINTSPSVRDNEDKTVNKTFLGSPRLHRAFFGVGKKTGREASPPTATEQGLSTSVSLHDSADEYPKVESPKTPSQPTMGVSMIGKRGRPSPLTSPAPDRSFTFFPEPVSPNSNGVFSFRISPSSPSSSPYCASSLDRSGRQPSFPVPPPPPPQYPDDIPVIEGIRYPPVFTPETYSLSGVRRVTSEQALYGGSTCTNLSSNSSILSNATTPSPEPRKSVSSVATQTDAASSRRKVRPIPAHLQFDSSDYGDSSA